MYNEMSVVKVKMYAVNRNKYSTFCEKKQTIQDNVKGRSMKEGYIYVRLGKLLLENTWQAREGLLFKFHNYQVP